jgi:hypothetical protein
MFSLNSVTEIIATLLSCQVTESYEITIWVSFLQSISSGWAGSSDQKYQIGP